MKTRTIVFVTSVALFAAIQLYSQDVSLTNLQNSNITLIGRCRCMPCGRGGTGVYVSGNYAYITDHNANLHIIDISTPTSPKYVSFCDMDKVYNYPWDAHGDVVVINNYVYIAAGLGLRIIDISTPVYPQQIGLYDTGDVAHEVYISDGMAYIAEGYSGLCIIDVSTSAQPRRIGICNLTSKVTDVYVHGDPLLELPGPGGPHRDRVGEQRDPGACRAVFRRGS